MQWVWPCVSLQEHQKQIHINLFTQFEVIKQTAHLIEVRIEFDRVWWTHCTLNWSAQWVCSEFAVSLTMYVSRKGRSPGGGGLAYIYIFLSIYIFIHIHVFICIYIYIYKYLHVASPSLDVPNDHWRIFCRRPPSIQHPLEIQAFVCVSYEAYASIIPSSLFSWLNHRRWMWNVWRLILETSIILLLWLVNEDCIKRGPIFV